MPITRIVAYAVEAPKAPRMAARTARVRCVGEMGEGVVAGADVMSVSALGSGVPVMGSMAGEGNSHVGRATSRTPVNAIRAARDSRMVKGSRSQMKQTSAVSVGMMNVMTVASEMFNHDKESLHVSSHPILSLRTAKSFYLQYSPNNPTNPHVPLNTKSPLTPLAPSGKSGVRCHAIHAMPRTVVQSMRTKMICIAWNLVSYPVASSLAAVFMIEPHVCARKTRTRPKLRS